jgi:hypothetical protein
VFFNRLGGFLGHTCFFSQNSISIHFPETLRLLSVFRDTNAMTHPVRNNESFSTAPEISLVPSDALEGSSRETFL